MPLAHKTTPATKSDLPDVLKNQISNNFNNFSFGSMNNQINNMNNLGIYNMI